MDEITLTGLRVFGRHGVYEDERSVGQFFLVDFTLRLDTRKAARTDDVVDTVHYGVAAQQVADIVAGDPVDLLETLAARIAEALLSSPIVESVRVTVHKPDAPIPLPFADVSVTVERERGLR